MGGLTGGCETGFEVQCRGRALRCCCGRRSVGRLDDDLPLCSRLKTVGFVILQQKIIIF